MKLFEEIKKKKLLIIGLLLVLTILFLANERQEELPYRVTGSELLEIKEQCKELAEDTKTRWNESNIGTHLLTGHGYSEFGGYCYAEFIQNFGEEDSKLLYNATEQKEEFRRAWPEDMDWYEKDFDWFILGKSRILDFRGPFGAY